MAAICPEKIINAGVIPLIPYHNIASLNNIVFNVNDTILLRLLACKDAKGQNGLCSYSDHINPNANKNACQISDIELAQIYFRHTIINNKAGSCIVIFIDGYNLLQTDMIFSIYQNTVNWLNIANEKPFLVVVYHGDPKFYNDISEARRMLDQKLKPMSNYKNPCDITYASEEAESLIITHTKLFSVIAGQNN